MTKEFKITELENELWRLEDEIYSSKKHGKDLMEYFPLVLKSEIIRAQIAALNWRFEDNDDRKKADIQMLGDELLNHNTQEFISPKGFRYSAVTNRDLNLVLKKYGYENSNPF